MGTGYTRQSSSEIIDSSTIFASHFNNEFNLLESAFSGISGHSHDGTLGEGPLISLVNSITGTLSVTNGGTGATTVPDARVALGLGTISTKNGPSVTVDNTLPRFDGTTGNFQTSNIVVTDEGVLTLNSEKITGLAPGTDLNDAVNFEQLTDVETALETSINDLDIELSEAISDLTDATNLQIGNLQDQIDELDFPIGEFREGLYDFGSDYLRRNGGIYDIADYPELAALLPALPDGVQWTPQASIPNVAGATPQDLAYGNGLYVAGGGLGYVFVSSDLSSWNSVQITAASGAIWYRTAYGAGVFVVSGNGGRIATAIDGVTWAVQTPLSGATWNDIIWTGSVFLLFGTASGGGGIIYQSTTGASGSWSSVSVPVGTTGILSAARDGSVIIAVTGTQALVSSDTGATWSLVATGQSGLRRVEMEPGTSNAVAVGTDGLIISTTNDGTSWSPQTSGTTALLSTIVHAEAGWLTSGTAGTALISTDMTTWTGAPTGSGENFVGAVVDPDNTENGYVIMSSGRTVLRGVRTLSTQFQVPNDDPTYGWVRAQIT